MTTTNKQASSTATESPELTLRGPKGELMLELRAKHILNKKGKLVKPKTHLHGQPMEVVVRIKKDADPTQNKCYTKWICQQMNKKEEGSKIKEEDFYKVYRDLQIFHAAKNKGLLKDEQKDIFKIKSYNDLFDLVKPFSKMPEIQSDNQVARNALVMETEEFEIYIPKSFLESQTLGGGTNWCTAASGGSYQFDNYTKNGALLIFQDKKDPKGKFQFHMYTGSFANSTDRMIDFIEWLEARPASVKEYMRDYVKEHLAKLTHDEELTGSINTNKVLVNGSNSPNMDKLISYLVPVADLQKLYSKVKKITGDVRWNAKHPYLFPELEEITGTLTVEFESKLAPSHGVAFGKLKKIGFLSTSGSLPENLSPYINLSGVEVLGNLSNNSSSSLVSQLSALKEIGTLSITGALSAQLSSLVKIGTLDYKLDNSASSVGIPFPMLTEISENLIVHSNEGIVFPALVKAKKIDSKTKNCSFPVLTEVGELTIAGASSLGLPVLRKVTDKLVLSQISSPDVLPLLTEAGVIELNQVKGDNILPKLVKAKSIRTHFTYGTMFPVLEEVSGTLDLTYSRELKFPMLKKAGEVINHVRDLDSSIFVPNPEQLLGANHPQAGIFRALAPKAPKAAKESKDVPVEGKKLEDPKAKIRKAKGQK
jgi:hypothetical protein